MSKNSRSQVYLEGMLNALNKVDYYIAQTDKSNFEKKEMAFDAICKQLEEVGENSKRLKECGERIPDKFSDVFDWTAIIGLRNRVSHQYGKIDANELWKIAQEDMPKVKVGVEQILRQRFNVS